MDKFMEINQDIIKEKVITYPMLGSQDEFTPEITNYGFKLVGLAVERLNFSNIGSLEVFKAYKQKPLPEGYKIVEWDSKYKDEVVNVINTSFANTSDANSDFILSITCKNSSSETLIASFSFFPFESSVLWSKSSSKSSPCAKLSKILATF